MNGVIRRRNFSEQHMTYDFGRFFIREAEHRAKTIKILGQRRLIFRLTARTLFPGKSFIRLNLRLRVEQFSDGVFASA